MSHHYQHGQGHAGHGHGQGHGQGQSQTLGYRPVRLITNSFEITQLPTRKYYQYDVTFEPVVEKKQRIKRQQLIQLIQLSIAPDVFNPLALYDGDNILYAPQRLRLASGGSGIYYVKLGTTQPGVPGERGVYKVTLTLTLGGEISPEHVNDLIINKDTRSNRALVATNLIQIIMRQAPNMYNTNNGRAYFTGRETKRLPGSGLELWRGIFLSVRPTIGKMVLNVDTCTAAVYQKGPIIDVALEILGKGQRNIRDLVLSERSPDFKRLEKFLKNVQLKVRTANGQRSRIKTIRGLIPAAGDFEFYNESAGQSMTVSQYFQDLHNTRVQYPQILGVRLTGKKNPHQDIVPFEFCEIEGGQLFRRKIPEELTSDMVRFSTMKPQERLARIQSAAKESVDSMFVQDSGMRLNSSPMSVNGKLLNVPTVFFNPNARELDVKDGAWNAVRQTLTSPQPVRAWIVVSFIRDASEADIRAAVVQQIGRCCTNLGMTVNPNLYIRSAANPHSTNRILTDAVATYMRQLKVPESEKEQDGFLRSLIVIVLLPQNGAAIRSAVKYWGDVERGVATQCLREGKLKLKSQDTRGNDQYFNNIALKINARLNGTNFHSVSPVLMELKEEPYMIIGADVGHPGPGVQKPSVTGLVYSHDEFATQYVAITGIQAPRVELIEGLRGYVYEAVENFGNKNRATLQNLIFYRDGISEGEFDRVAATEIKEIKEAFKEVFEKRGIKSDLPKLTYIVVGKRHHAVFFPNHPSEGDPRTGNARAGSLIDSGITHPSGKDFYLQSHAAIQGTCRSSHYTVLHDEIWNGDLTKIQELSYTLCHLYAKATRSVSIPAPVYYADLVCSRGQFHIDPSAPLDFGENDNASTTSGGTLDLHSWHSAFRPVHKRLDKTMYFL